VLLDWQVETIGDSWYSPFNSLAPGADSTVLVHATAFKLDGNAVARTYTFKDFRRIRLQNRCPPQYGVVPLI
jgi:hypothetical protein